MLPDYIVAARVTTSPLATHKTRRTTYRDTAGRPVRIVDTPVPDGHQQDIKTTTDGAVAALCCSCTTRRRHVRYDAPDETWAQAWAELHPTTLKESR